MSHPSLLVFALANVAQPPLSDDAIVAISQTVITEEVRANVRLIDEAHCVEPRFEGVTFDRSRSRRSELEARLARSPNDQHSLRALEQHRTYQFMWQPAGHAGAGVPRLEPSEAGTLDLAAHAAILAPASDVPAVMIDRSRVSGSLAACSVRQLPRLTLSAPIFRNGIAFIETGFVCGGHCGWGRLYALRRSAVGWTIVGIAPTWIS